MAFQRLLPPSKVPVVLERLNSTAEAYEDVLNASKLEIERRSSPLKQGSHELAWLDMKERLLLE